jgi:transposase
LAGFSDVGLEGAEAAVVGYVHVPGVSARGNGARHLWRSEGAHHQAQTTLKKTRCGGCGCLHNSWYDRTIRRVRDLSCGDTRIYLELEVRRVRCRTTGKVKREQLEFLADNPLYTKRFAFFVGRRCRQATVKDVAKELQLHWHTVNEISVRKGHDYRIVVSDLERRRPIWFGGTDRSEKSMNMFYDWLGQKKSHGIRLAVMDMWRPFRNATGDKAPKAAILFDKFHIMKHLGEALDAVRKSEYARVCGRQRRFIKGQKYTLLSRRTNLSVSGKRALELLLKANKRLNTAYMLKESFGQLWDYEREPWARKFFENWRASLKWQRLKKYEKFAQMIDEHWDGIAAYCKPENKVSLGFVEGLNAKIRVIQRRAYGFRDEEYLRLKVLTCMLPEL